jgi:Vitamin K-dependent gamma-carboxylase
MSIVGRQRIQVDSTASSTTGNALATASLMQARNRAILSLDFQSLSLFRIAFAAFLLGHFFLVDRVDNAVFYGEAGLVPFATLIQHSFLGYAALTPALKAFEAIGFPVLLPVVLPLSVIAIALGYRTRWAIAVTFVFETYLYWRNPYVKSGAEDLAHLLLLWCLFLPLDRYWSIDAAMDRRPRDRPFPLLPVLALRLQIASLYVFPALFKLASNEWIDGTAVLWSLADNIFGGRPIGLLLIAHIAPLLVAVNYATIALQLAFPFLIYSPWRNDLTRAFALGAAVTMHVSFIFCLTIGPFPYVSIIALLPLVPDAWIVCILRRRRERLGCVVIFFEPGCDFCEKVSLLLREFLLSPTASVLPAYADGKALCLLRTHNSWVVRDAEGCLRLKSAAMAYLLRQNPVLAPCGRLLARWPADRLYDVIGAHRKGFGRVTALLLSFRSPPAIGRGANALCGALALLALTINVTDVRLPAFLSHSTTPLRFVERTPLWLLLLAVDAQVWQRWPLFAPPPHWQRTYRIVATTADGSDYFDLMAQLTEPWFRAMLDGRIAFSDARWLKYFTQFDVLKSGDWEAFGAYLCRVAQSVRPASRSVTSIELSTQTQPWNDTPVAGMPPDQHRSFDCREI